MREPLNPRLIRVVTAQFTELQGLYLAVVGMCLLVTSTSYAILGSEPFWDLYRTIVDLAPLFFYFWAIDRVPRYYARRFGRVESSRGAMNGTRILVPLWILVWVLPVPTRGGASVIWFLWPLMPLSAVWRGWPYRTHHLMNVAVTGCLAWSRLTTTATGAARDHEMLVQAFALSSALILTGLGDHFVLLRALPRPEPRTVPDEA